MATLSTGFAALAVLLSMLGLYGVIAYRSRSPPATGRRAEPPPSSRWSRSATSDGPAVAVAGASARLAEAPAQLAGRQPEPRAQGAGKHVQGRQLGVLERQVALEVGVARHQIVDLDAGGRGGARWCAGAAAVPGASAARHLGVDARQVVVEPSPRLQQVAHRQPALPVGAAQAHQPGAPLRR